MRKILVTGASGFLGHFVVHELLKHADFSVIAIGGRPEDKANPLEDHPRMKYYMLDALFSEEFGIIDTVVNCAFARSNDAALLAGALEFTTKAIKRFESLGVESVINISTQGVYRRLESGKLATENSPIEPIDMYSIVKYGVEKMFDISSIPFVTNVRLASLMMSQRFLYFFIKKAKAGEHFSVTAPKQKAALLDVTDAASALVAVAELSPSVRAKIYNLGIGTQYSLLDYAKSVQDIGKQFGYSADFDVNNNDTENNAGMDCTLLMNDTGWRPTVLKDEMITNLYKEI